MSSASSICSGEIFLYETQWGVVGIRREARPHPLRMKPWHCNILMPNQTPQTLTATSTPPRMVAWTTVANRPWPMSLPMSISSTKSTSGWSYSATSKGSWDLRLHQHSINTTATTTTMKMMTKIPITTKNKVIGTGKPPGSCVVVLVTGVGTVVKVVVSGNCVVVLVGSKSGYETFKLHRCSVQQHVNTSLSVLCCARTQFPPARHLFSTVDRKHESNWKERRNKINFFLGNSMTQIYANST